MAWLGKASSQPLDAAAGESSERDFDPLRSPASLAFAGAEDSARYFAGDPIAPLLGGCAGFRIQSLKVGRVMSRAIFTVSG